MNETSPAHRPCDSISYYDSLQHRTTPALVFTLINTQFTQIHKTASPSTQRKQSFYATSFCVPSAIPKACCLNTTYKSAGCRNARQRTNARLPSNNTKHISDQRPSRSSISRKKLFHSYQQSGCTTKNLTNCFSSTPGRLQMTREP